MKIELALMIAGLGMPSLCHANDSAKGIRSRANTPEVPRTYVVQKIEPYLVDCIDMKELVPDGRRVKVDGSLLTVKDAESNDIAEVYVPKTSKHEIGQRLERVRLRIAKQFYYGAECTPGSDPKVVDSRILEHPDRLRKNTDYFLTAEEAKRLH